MSDLAAILMHEGRYAEAEKLYHEAFDIESRVFRPENRDTLSTLESEAIDLSHEGRYADAEIRFREAIQVAGKTNATGVIAPARYSFACGANIAGHHEEALQYLHRAVALGYGTSATIAADPDLKSMHGDARFKALIAKAHEQAKASAQ